MAFADSTLAQRQAVRDAVITLDKITSLAHDTGPLADYGDAVDDAAAVAVEKLMDTGSALPATASVVRTGDTVAVTNSAKTAVAGTHTVTVTDGAATVALDAKVAPVVDAASVNISNSADSKSVKGTITVAAGVVSKVAAPATAAITASGDAVTVPVTFTTAREAGAVATVAVTVTVAAGVITAISIA